MKYNNIKLVRDVWQEIKKQSIPNSGIHLSLQICPDGDIVVVADMERFNKRFAVLTLVDKNIANGINRIIGYCINTKKAKKKDLIKMGILK